ncbi:MAG: serine protease Do [Actinomycetota bacterium]|nr:serine protease Do [Actinomycetota bacterium]
MDDEDDGLYDEPVAPLLPPDDRLWRHPTEMAKELGRLGGGGGASHEPRMVTVVALTSCISVLLTLGLIAVVRPIKTRIAVERIGASVSSVGDVAELADRIRPAVVQVVASTAAGVESWGSGVVYRSDGMMLTSEHVVKDARSVRVLLGSGVEVPARVVGMDAETDIALIDLDGNDFEVAPLGFTDGVRVGQPAITIGSPNGNGGGLVVRVSVVSALGQEAGVDGHKLVDMMQTDTAVAPGCAGAPVLDAHGAVIGIAAANVTTDAGAIGYATPIDVARAVATQLLDNGKVTRGWLGVEGETLTAERSKELGVPGGAVVRRVKPTSPAEAGGLQAADVIVAVDQAALPTWSALVVRLRSLRPGDTISLTVVRDGQRKTVPVTLAEKPTA